MYANLWLGLRDIWKYKLFFGACIVFLVVFCTVVSIVCWIIVGVIDYRKSWEARTLEIFEPVYTQYEFTYNREHLENISWIYQKNAVSSRISLSLSNRYGRPVYLVFGDGSLINPGIANQEGIAVYAYDTCDLDKVEILGVEHKVRPTLSFSETFEFSGITPFPDPDSIFVAYQGKAMVDVIHLMAEQNPDRFIEILGDTWIRAEDSERIEYFTKYVTDHIEGLYFKGYSHNQMPKDYSSVIIYVVLMAIILSLTGAVSFVVIFQGMLQRMQRDLTIHLQSGARFRDVLLRFYVFYGAIIGVSVAILHMLGVINYRFIGMPEEYVALLAIYGTLLAVVIGISAYIARALKRTNLFENLRGDMV